MTTELRYIANDIARVAGGSPYYGRRGVPRARGRRLLFGRQLLPRKTSHQAQVPDISL